MQPDAERPAVEIENLVKRFGDFVAVDHVSLEVRAGEIFGFLGPNGAGKVDHHPHPVRSAGPTRATATVAGFDVATQSEEIKQNIGYMSQKFSLYDDLTVEENIEFFSGVYGVPREAAPERKRLRSENGGPRRQAQDHDALLAGGWKQRLALGCAILHEPPILFLDEPTSGVDPDRAPQFLGADLSAFRGRATPSSSPRITWTRPNTATASR